MYVELRGREASYLIRRLPAVVATLIEAARVCPQCLLAFLAEGARLGAVAGLALHGGQARLARGWSELWTSSIGWLSLRP